MGFKEMLKKVFHSKDQNIIIETKTPVDDLLPIGSIVTLPNLTYRIMVIGIKQISYDENREYDYMGVPYPVGLIGDDSLLLFNKEDIENIDYIGFQDSERIQFINDLKEYLQKR